MLTQLLTMTTTHKFPSLALLHLEGADRRAVEVVVGRHFDNVLQDGVGPLVLAAAGVAGQLALEVHLYFYITSRRKKKRPARNGLD